MSDEGFRKKINKVSKRKPKREDSAIHLGISMINKKVTFLTKDRTDRTNQMPQPKMCL